MVKKTMLVFFLLFSTAVNAFSASRFNVIREADGECVNTVLWDPSSGWTPPTGTRLVPEKVQIGEYVDAQNNKVAPPQKTKTSKKIGDLVVGDNVQLNPGQ